MVHGVEQRNPAFLSFLKFYLFLVVLGLHCCAWAFSSCGERGPVFVAIHGLLIAMASLVVEHRLSAHGLQYLQRTDSIAVARLLSSLGSVVVVCGLSCSEACGIFPDQGSNLCPNIGRWASIHCTTREVPSIS